MSGRRPLDGKRIVVTRAREQAEEFSKKLRALGAVPIVWPLIEIAPPEDCAPLDEAIQHIAEYDWVVFSSVNGVKYFFERASHQPLPLPRIAAVGVKTAEALQQRGLRGAVVPAEFLASYLMSALGDVRDQKILLVRPDIAPPDLMLALREHGARVDEVTAYRTVPVQYERPIALDKVDVVTLASASAAKNFAAQLRGQPVDESVCVACIGLSTSKAAREAGLRVDVEALTHTLDGLIAALVEYFRQ